MSAVGWHIACTTITRPVHDMPALFSSHILITHQPSIACLFHCLSARVSQKSRIQTSPYLQWMLPEPELGPLAILRYTSCTSGHGRPHIGANGVS